MKIFEFEAKYRLRVRRDACGDSMIPGKFGHLYEHAVEEFGLVLEDPVRRPVRPGMTATERLPLWLPSRARALLARRRKALAAGFVAHQIGEAEAILLFNPSDFHQARLAIRVVGAKTRRRASPEQLKALKTARESRLIRPNPCAEAVPGAKNGTSAAG